MANQHPELHFTMVELACDIQVQTSLPPSCHSALRAGFAGYTDNPRWTPQKRRAWKQGQQWRRELADHLIEIRDGVLLTQEALAQAAVKDSQPAHAKVSENSKTGLIQALFGWSRKKPAMN